MHVRAIHVAALQAVTLVTTFKFGCDGMMQVVDGQASIVRRLPHVTYVLAPENVTAQRLSIVPVLMNVTMRWDFDIDLA
jgi:hypothetical protein